MMQQLSHFSMHWIQNRGRIKKQIAGTHPYKFLILQIWVWVGGANICISKTFSEDVDAIGANFENYNYKGTFLAAKGEPKAQRS